MKRIFVFLVCLPILFVACSKNSEGPENNIRVTAYRTSEGNVTLSYNEAGMVSQTEREGSFQSPLNPWPTRTKTTTSFEYERKVLKSAKSQLSILFSEPVILQVTSFYTWDINGRLLETYGENDQNKLKWISDGNGRIAGFTDPQGKTSKWSYDKDGNVIPTPPYPGSKLSVTYNKHSNPFKNGNAGIIEFIANSSEPKNAMKFLSAHLPERYEFEYTTYMNSPEGSTPIATNSEIILYDYSFDANGLLVSVTEKVKKTTQFADHEFPNIYESTTTYPNKCIRLN